MKGVSEKTPTQDKNKLTTTNPASSKPNLPEHKNAQGFSNPAEPITPNKNRPEELRGSKPVGKPTTERTEPKEAGKIGSKAPTS